MSGIRTNPKRVAPRRILWLVIVTSAPLALGACQVPDTSGADATWSPKGINAANLAAMVADPADLVRGRDDAGPEHKLAAHAVIDLWSNPTGAAQGAASGGSGSGSQAASGGGAGAGTGAGN